MWPRVDLHEPKLLILHFPTPKMLIIQLPASNVWKNAIHTIFIQSQNTIEKRFNLVSPAIWTEYNNDVNNENNWWWKITTFVFFEKKCLSYNFHLRKNVYPSISIYEKMLILQFPFMEKRLS